MEKEWQRGAGIEREERMLCKVRKIICRERKIPLLDKMIWKKIVGCLAHSQKPDLDHAGDNRRKWLTQHLDFPNSGLFQTFFFQAYLMLIINGDSVALRTGHIPF